MILIGSAVNVTGGGVAEFCAITQAEPAKQQRRQTDRVRDRKDRGIRMLQNGMLAAL